jgi:RNA polymerase sigma-70 factor (ECF subfamily)
MTPAATQPAAAPPADPVQAALRDPEVRSRLLDHARAVLGRQSVGRPRPFSVQEVDDAVQETELRALNKRGEYDPSAGPVPPWLHGILNNVLREMARSLRGLPVQPPADLAAWERLTADVTARGPDAVLDRLAAEDYLARLRDETRELLRLRFYEGLPHEEIATRLGISAGSARVRLSRAVAELKTIAGAGPKGERP